MIFAIGYVAGLVTGLLVLVCSLILRRPAEIAAAKAARWVERELAVSPRGAVIMPEDDAEVLRRERIEQNAKEGKDTPLSELL